MSVREGERRQVLARRMLAQLSDSGDVEYRFQYGCLLMSGKAPHPMDDAQAQALDLIEEAAQKGSANAMFFMGKAHAGGKYGLPSSDLAAVEWLARAAEAGHAAAQFKLGVFYQYGRGVRKDQFMATEWFLEAAEQDDADAQFALGVAFGKGRGVTKSHEQVCPPLCMVASPATW